MPDPDGWPPRTVKTSLCASWSTRVPARSTTCARSVPEREGGAYVRVVPRPGGGSVIAMTLPLLPGVNPTDTAATLAQELDALAALVERH